MPMPYVEIYGELNSHSDTYQPDRPAQYNLLAESAYFYFRAVEHYHASDIDTARQMAARATATLGSIDTIIGETGVYTRHDGRTHEIDFGWVRDQRDILMQSCREMLGQSATRLAIDSPVAA